VNNVFISHLRVSDNLYRFHSSPLNTSDEPGSLKS
jgi:hypothetical protein